MCHNASPALVLLVALAVRAGGTEPEKPMKAVLVHYTGRVQGVGFRATAVMIARDYPVTGWVKNLPDDRVQMLVEGSEADIGRFLKAVREHWKGDIEKEETEDRKPSGSFKKFEIAR
jgi:acylphosphatase